MTDLEKKLIIFDLDGTLTDTVEVDDYCFKETFRKLYDINIDELDMDSLKVFSGGTDSGLTDSIFKAVFNRRPHTEEIRKIKNQFMSLLVTELSKHPEKFNEVNGAKLLIQNLRKQKKFLFGIATGSWYESAILKLQNILKSISGIPLASADIAIAREDIIKNLINAIKISSSIKNFSSITYIGDGVWDYNATQNLGIDFIGVIRDKKSDLTKLNLTKTISDYKDFLDLIRA